MKFQQQTLDLHVECAVTVLFVTQCRALPRQTDYGYLNGVSTLEEVWAKFRILSAEFARPAEVSK